MLTDGSVSARKTGLSTEAIQREQHLIDYGPQHRMLVREVNERIREINLDFDLATGTYELLCECERGDCLGRIEVPVAVYEEARSDGQLFLLTPGHEQPAHEHVVRDGTGWVSIRQLAKQTARAMVVDRSPREEATSIRGSSRREGSQSRELDPTCSAKNAGVEKPPTHMASLTNDQRKSI